MAVPVRERGNEQWLADLRGPDRDKAIVDLRLILMRGLRAALHGRTSGIDPSLEDFVQESLIKILGNLDSFRGESRFTVWAQKIAVRTAFAEMRHRRWRDVSLEEAIERQGHGEPADALEDPELEAARRMMMATFGRFVEEELTERQRTSLLAAMGGMPLEEIARHMDTNRNALYKLLHDARKRLKKRMTEENLSLQDILVPFGG